MTDKSGLKSAIEKAYVNGDFREEFSLDFIQRTLFFLFMSFDEILFRNSDYELEKAITFLQEFVIFLKHGLKRV